MLVGAQLERGAIEALATGEPERGAATFLEASTAYAGFHRRGELRSLWAAGEAFRRSGDEPAAKAALEGVEPDLEAHRFVPILGRVHRSLRLLGVRRAVRAAAIDRTARLTAREREIAELVGRGLTNPEIARRLGLGRPTVARLLSNAMLKEGVDSRAQLVARMAGVP